MKTSTRVALATGAWLLCGAAQAADDWKWQGIVYGYLPEISGSTRFPVQGSGSGVSVDAEKIIDSLKFTFMGTLEAHKGPWGLYTDVIYMDIGAGKSRSRDLTVGGVTLPAGVDANLNYDLKGWSWTLAGTYRVSRDPKSVADVVVGARLLDIDQRLRYELTGDIGSLPLPGRSGESTVNLGNWDAIAGVKGRLALGDSGRWFVPYYADIGAGESKLTWQVIGGIGYSFGWGDVIAAYRHLDYEMKSDKKVETLTFSGPALAAVFRW